MRHSQFQEVYKMAETYAYPKDEAFINEALRALEGLAVDRHVRAVTKAQAACVLNYQCRMMNGLFDSAALNEMYELYKRYVRLLD